MSLNLLINLVSAGIAGIGYFVPEPYGAYVRAVGWFAFSGAATNWLAIYMLFEKVPGFYGSGIIQLRFREFQRSLERLIQREFLDNPSFRAELQGFIERALEEAMPLDRMRQKIDLDKVFEAFKAAVLDSSFGGMLKMFGGASALEPLKEPIQRKLGALLDETLRSAAADLPSSSAIEAGLSAAVRRAVATRVAALKPVEVKNLLHELTDRYTPWLVIWGAVFGGVLGALSVLLQP